MRNARFKLVKIGNEPPQVFDLSADIGETTNLADQKEDVMKGLSAALAKWDSQLAKPLWGGQRRQAQRRRVRPAA